MRMHGWFRTLCSDGELAFKSRDFMAWLRSFNVHIVKIIPYDHRSNGLVERANKTVIKLLRSLCCQYKRGLEWWKHLQEPNFIYNSSMHKSSGH